MVDLKINRLIFTILWSGMIGFFFSFGVYYVTGSTTIEALIGLPVSFANGIIIGILGQK